MGYRVNQVVVRMSVYQEFEGISDIQFAYEPLSNDDPLVVALLQKNRELIDAQIALAPIGQMDLLFL